MEGEAGRAGRGKDGKDGKLYEVDGYDQEGDQKIRPKVCMSDVMADTHVFPFLLQALLVAYCKDIGVDDQLTGVKEGAPLGERPAFKVSQTSFEWLELKKGLTAKIDYKAYANKNCDYFYILGKLRDGQCAAVYLAANTGGSVCAMKSYYTKSSHGKKEIEENEMTRVMELSKLEENRWQELYKDRDSKPAHSSSAELLVFSCLIVMT